MAPRRRAEPPPPRVELPAPPFVPPAVWRTLAQRLMGEPSLTAADVAARAGTAGEHTQRLWRALGMPPVPAAEAAFSEADVASVRTVGDLMERFPASVDTVVQLARVMGRALARVADACVGVIGDRASTETPDATKDAALADAVEALVPVFEPALVHVWRHHLLAAVLRTMAARDDTEAGHQRQAVGFADLVGFTALGEQLDAAQLTALVDRFEALAYEGVVGRGGRVVKMIGDEVMFAADTPAVAAEIGLGLVETAAHGPAVPPLRVGLAFGPTVTWEGDLFGPTVNLASRLVAIARPGTVLASDALGEALDPVAFRVRRLRPLALKGLGKVRFWVVRR